MALLFFFLNSQWILLLLKSPEMTLLILMLASHTEVFSGTMLCPGIFEHVLLCCCCLKFSLSIRGRAEKKIAI